VSRGWTRHDPGWLKAKIAEGRRKPEILIAKASQ
jgi:hypothetical protein